MRLLAILSPVDKWGTKTEYTNLRKFLRKDGYIRIAPEVYMRVIQGRRTVRKHILRINEFAPKSGVVRVIKLTEKQFDNTYMITGKIDYQEQMVGRNCNIVI